MRIEQSENFRQMRIVMLNKCTCFELSCTKIYFKVIKHEQKS